MLGFGGAIRGQVAGFDVFRWGDAPGRSKFQLELCTIYANIEVENYSEYLRLRQQPTVV